MYFKKPDSNQWHGPAKVLGLDGQQVLVINGSLYLRVLPCRLQLIDKNSQTYQPSPLNQNTINQHNHSQSSPFQTEQQQTSLVHTDHS